MFLINGLRLSILFRLVFFFNFVECFNLILFSFYFVLILFFICFCLSSFHISSLFFPPLFTNLKKNSGVTKTLFNIDQCNELVISETNLLICWRFVLLFFEKGREKEKSKKVKVKVKKMS